MILIPQIFHRIWLGDKEMPEEFVYYGETWKKLHPSWKIKLWTEENIPKLINQEAFDNAKLVAGSRTDDNNKIIGIDNDFMKAYIDIADNVNACTLYQDVSHSYYNDNVIGDIVDNYIHKGISKDKFIRQLSAATEIYLTE